MKHDPVFSPSHYTHGPMEVIDIIEGFGLGFTLGNTIKYILRSDKKGRPVEDLEKARWYLDREISRRKKADGSSEHAAAPEIPQARGCSKCGNTTHIIGPTWCRGGLSAICTGQGDMAGTEHFDYRCKICKYGWIGPIIPPGSSSTSSTSPSKVSRKKREA